MSSKLYWKPVEANDRVLSNELKLLLREAYAFPVDLRMESQHTGHLRVLRVGRSAEIQKEINALIAAIETHQAIDLYEDNW